MRRVWCGEAFGELAEEEKEMSNDAAASETGEVNSTVAVLLESVENAVPDAEAASMRQRPGRHEAEHGADRAEGEEPDMEVKSPLLRRRPLQRGSEDTCSLAWKR